MKKIIVNGGKALSGKVCVSGSKNAVLPILFATLVTRGVSVIKNVADIGDVEVALGILRSFGAEVVRRGSTVTVNTENLEYKKPDEKEVCKIRASTYLIGSCLSRFGICHLQSYGGCNFSQRPIDLHLAVAEKMGATVNEESVVADSLRPAEIWLSKQSVGATVNALIMTASTEGKSTVEGFALEPHIMSLIEYLCSCGAEISREGERLVVKGEKLHGGNITVIGDMIEAGTFCAAAVATGGDITVSGVDEGELSALFDLLSEAGASYEISGEGVRFFGEFTRSVEIVANPYPAFPTDLQPIFAPVLAKFFGGRIDDRVWRERYGYLRALSGFGIGCAVVSSTAYIYPSSLRPATVSATDLRGGAGCLIAALAAKGRSEIYASEKISRGYENITKKFRTLGADVKEIRNT